jgi:hypothetical protein
MNHSISNFQIFVYILSHQKYLVYQQYSDSTSLISDKHVFNYSVQFNYSNYSDSISKNDNKGKIKFITVTYN